MWFCSLFRLKTELENLKEDIHDVLANTLDEVFARAGDNSSAMPKLDDRVRKGTMTRFEFYVEMLECRDRTTKPTTQVPESEKVFTGNRKIEEVQEKTEEQEVDGSVFAMEVLSKDPTAKLLLEKIAKIESRMCESSFTSKDEDKKKEKRKRNKEKEKESSSGSDSDSEEKRTKKIIKLMNKKFDELISNGFQNQNQTQNDYENQDYNKQNGFTNPKTNICFSFKNTGKCFRGDKCQFEHSQASTGEKKKCFDFMNGDCTRGNACRFAH
jgi:hypothetical protein